MELKYSNRFNSFCKSLDNLKASIHADRSDFFVLPATIQNYNLTMDLAWKVMKELLTQYHGVTDFAAGSPKQVLKQAFATEMISDDIWLEMLNTRNKLAHDYDGEIANKYFEIIIGDYYKQFDNFKHYVLELQELGE